MESWLVSRDRFLNLIFKSYTILYLCRIYFTELQFGVGVLITVLIDWLNYKKKAVRHVCNAKYNCHTNPLFHQLRCLKLHDAYKLYCCKIAYKRKLNILPAYHSSKLPFNHEIRPCNTRQNDLVALIKPTSFLKINSFNYRVGEAWNNIPSNIKINSNYKRRSEKCFASKIKDNLLKSYTIPCSIRNCSICKRQA